VGRSKSDRARRSAGAGPDGGALRVSIALREDADVVSSSRRSVQTRAKRPTIFVGVFLLFGVALWSIFLRVGVRKRVFLPFSSEKDCAIAVTDDTDDFQFSTTAPVYDLLNALGWRVTKTVWAFDSPGRNPDKLGLSLASPDYQRWVLGQARHGHEIVLHSATAGDDTRATTIAAYERMRSLLGTLPRVEIFHQDNKEAFFWGGDRLPFSLLSRAYGIARPSRFFGQDPSSPYYWVDLSRSLVRYVRTYTTSQVDS
jgi:hypothetical protein